ncbi:efflux RND transporter periplasmic adaptor subunit [Ideonella livida]|nr:efflux RND transporter periplasmic adaptor subunit [Ideonella livida]
MNTAVLPRRPLRPVLAAAWAGWLLLSGAPLLAVGPGVARAQAPEAPRVPVLTLQPVPAAAGLSLDGQVQAVRQATVAAQLGGTVQALAVKAGDVVAAGQPLLRLDERDAAAALGRAEAGVVEAQAQATLARQQLQRQRELRAQGFVSAAALEAAEAQAAAAQAGLQQAQAARSQAGLARGFATVAAPFAGVVQATHVDVGDLAAPGRALVTLFQPGALRVVVQVPQSRQALARAASGAQVQLPDGRWVAVLRRQGLPTADPVAQTVEWRLDLPVEVARELAPGQALRVRFEVPAQPAAGAASANVPTIATAPALTLPPAAVLRRGELTAVYVAQDERFVLRAVRLGAADAGGRLPVLAGLRAGEAVAAEAVRAGLAHARPAR